MGIAGPKRVNLACHGKKHLAVNHENRMYFLGFPYMEDPQNIVYRVNLGGTSMSDKIPILLYHKNVLSLLCATTAPRCLGPYFNDTYEIMCIYICI